MGGILGEINAVGEEAGDAGRRPQVVQVVVNAEANLDDGLLLEDLLDEARPEEAVRLGLLVEVQQVEDVTVRAGADLQNGDARREEGEDGQPLAVQAHYALTLN